MGVSVTSLIGSLGAAGAAVAVVYYFLGYMRNQDERHSTMVKTLYDQLEVIAKDKGLVIRENTGAMERNTESTRRLEGAIKDLAAIVRRDPGPEMRS